MNLEETKMELSRLANQLEERAQFQAMQFDKIQTDLAVINTRLQALEQNAVTGGNTPQAPSQPVTDSPPDSPEKKTSYSLGGVDLLVNYFVHNAILNNKLILYEPEFRRNYIHVRDIINTFIFAIDNFQKVKNNIFNVGLSSANLTKIDLCRKIKKHIPSFEFEVSKDGTDPDKRDYFVSNKKIESLGWKPKVSLDDGIIELLQVYKLINLKDFDKNI